MKSWILFPVILLFSISTAAQNLVGLKSTEIMEYMKNNKGELKPEKVVNSQFNYLKYTDGGNMQTVLFFLNRDSVCRSVRVICDLALKNEKINELNTIYKKSGENRWTDNRDGKEFSIDFKVDKWSFTVTIEPQQTN